MLMPTKTPALRNAMSIDVEDYFQVSAFAPHIRREDWSGLECRVERNIGRILELLADQQVKATFFTLGWIAERYPQVVRAIVAGGHELASHGYGHERASDLNPAAFLADIASAKKLLEDLGGVPVVGYRAPSFSIGKGNLWAFDVLLDAGYRYSSSVYPIAHDHYGMPDSPRFAYPVRDGLLEIPVTTLRLGARNLPSSGGGYFRLLPYALSRWMMRRVRWRAGRLLLPPVGDRSRPAAHCGHRRQDALPPLREHLPHRGPHRPPAAGFPLGPDGRDLPRPRCQPAPAGAFAEPGLNESSPAHCAAARARSRCVCALGRLRPRLPAGHLLSSQRLAARHRVGVRPPLLFPVCRA